MKEKICKNCKRWDREEGTSDTELPKSGKGICLWAVHSDPYSDETEDSMVVMDGSMYMAMLFTAPEHYCKEFLEREEDNQ